ncbi:TRAP transporter small permease subunit [Thiospirillum jenense]|nr:TRAP transporter small permease subunit [Thiospirillum jenense]
MLLKMAARIDRFNQILGQMTVWLVLLCVVLSALTATLRYLFDWGSNAMIEAQWFAFGLIFLFCAPWTLQQQGHVRVDILYTALPPRGRIIVDLIGSLFFLLPVCGLVIVNAWDYFFISFQQHELSMNPGGLLWWPMKLAILLGFIFLAAQGIAEIIKGIAILMGQSPSPIVKSTAAPIVGDH